MRVCAVVLALAYPLSARAGFCLWLLCGICAGSASDVRARGLSRPMLAEQTMLEHRVYAAA